MMVIWIAVFGMICWGIAPIFAKVGLRGVNPAAALIVRTMFAAIIVTSWVAMSGSFGDLLKGFTWQVGLLLGMEAILATVIGDLAYYTAVKYGDVSVVSLIMASAPLVTVICAVLLLGESLTIWKVLGACYVMLGILLLI
ncbi:MAG TPA: transporter [Syntrophomonas sp.]|jgi:transporter family protein|nr:transporter [Syntrophomonas sp.]